MKFRQENKKETKQTINGIVISDTYLCVAFKVNLKVEFLKMLKARLLFREASSKENTVKSYVPSLVSSFIHQHKVSCFSSDSFTTSCACANVLFT